MERLFIDDSEEEDKENQIYNKHIRSKEKEIGKLFYEVELAFKVKHSNKSNIIEVQSDSDSGSPIKVREHEDSLERNIQRKWRNELDSNVFMDTDEEESDRYSNSSEEIEDLIKVNKEQISINKNPVMFNYL